MADLYQYNSNLGIIVPDTAEVQTQVENEFMTAFGSDLVLDPTTPEGRLIEMETLARQGAIGLCALIANQINMDYATGQFLDAIGSFFGVDRIGATSTSVLATLTGIPGTIIPAGSLAESAAGNQFYLENTVTLGIDGTITAYFLSVELGAIPLAVGTLTTIVSQIVGWETINNPAAAQIGIQQESDFNYRNRIKDARFQGISLLQSIKGALNQVTNLKSSFVMDNPKGTSITYQGLTLPAHSILVIADGGSDQDIAEAIFNKKSSGSDYTSLPNQSVTVPVVDGAYGVSYNVIFNRPNIIQQWVIITVRRNYYTGSDEELTADIINAIINWASGNVASVDGLTIGHDLSSYEVAAAVSEQIPAIYISSVYIGNTSSSTQTGRSCNINEKIEILPQNIKVTIK